MSSWCYASGRIIINLSSNSEIIKDIFGEHDEWTYLGYKKKRPYGTEGSIHYSCDYQYDIGMTTILIEGSLRDRDPDFCEEIKNWFIDVIKKLKSNSIIINKYYIEIRSDDETKHIRIENGKIYERVLVEKEIDFG